MPKAPDQERYSDVLVPYAIRNLLEQDPHFQGLFQSAKFPTLKINDYELFNKDITWIDNFLDIDGTTPISRALAVYLPNDIQLKKLANGLVERKPTVFIEVGVRTKQESLQGKASEDCLVICKDIESTINKNKSLIQTFVNPWTNITENFHVQSCEVGDYQAPQRGAFNNNFWACITLLQVEVITF